ncbi:MAG: hypothetical protein ACEY3J_00475 [Arsenophonus sp.]
MLLIDYMNDFNNKEMIFYKKFSRQDIQKPDITSDPFHELIYNAASQMIDNVVEAEQLEAIL